jgi:hypothetical protein
MQDPYRSLPPPAQMYPGYGPPMGYAAPAQPAPRQRTAIACRYCRRRKVCSVTITASDATTRHAHRIDCILAPSRVASHRIRAHTDASLDSLLRLRSIRRRALHQLPALLTGMCVHARLCPDTGLCASSHSLARSAASRQRPALW